MRIRQLLVFAGLFLLTPAVASGLGADHPDKPAHNSIWPKGMAKLVNAEQRVHGYFVNSQDVFFFRGGASKLNGFLGEYATLPNTRRKVVLHPGKLQVKSPWDEEPTGTADWRLRGAPADRDQAGEDSADTVEYVARVDIYLGGSLEPSEIKLPDNVAVESDEESELYGEPARKQSREKRPEED